MKRFYPCLLFLFGSEALSLLVVMYLLALLLIKIFSVMPENYY